MRKLTLRDILATLVVAAVVVPFNCRAVWSAAGHSQPDPLSGDCGTPGLLFRAGTRKLLKGWR